MERLHRAGLRMTLGSENVLLATPASAVTTDLRTLIVARKAEIVDYLSDSDDDPATTRASVQEKFKAASLALDAVIAAAGLMANPDRWCWPEGDAMTTAEIDTFMARVALFGRQGLALAQAQALADRLVTRDRDGDDRRMCLECAHLNGARCNNWSAALIAIRARDAFMPPELLRLLQHCPGFKAAGGAPWA